jgi:hypothetical protein
MTYLSRLAKLGGAKETSQYTYLAPTFSIPFNSAQYTNNIAPLRDESFRANDAVLQGLQQGPRTTDWEIGTNAYADIIGNWFRAIIGPDTVTAGVSTTLAANSVINASTVSLTATVTANSGLQISDSAGANLEYVQISTVTGSGPYTATIAVGGGTGGNTTRFAHTAAGGSVVSQTTHLFQQNRTFSTVWPTYSFTTDTGPTGDQLGWPGNVASEVAIKIDPKNFVTVSPKFTGMPAQAESTFAYAASSAQAVVGWAWTLTNGAASSTRGLTMDFTLKRAVEAIAASDGLQAPREIFPGALEAEGSYKAIFENELDMNLYEQYLQEPTVHTLTQPVTLGGAVLKITMSQSGYPTGKRDLGQQYVQASYDVSGIANATDSTLGGVAQVSLQNFVTTSY